VKPELGFRERLGQFTGAIGGGVRRIQELLPEKYQFGENILENFIESAKKPAREKKAEALNKVIDETTALGSVVNSFLSIKEQLDDIFPESDFTGVLDDLEE
ncbi:MAG: hypothetical protein F6K17_21160, partial [Okeania sp. SIO3C4]|nr:hypothetical protein [Okeania sp. SIO3C4]